MRCIEKRVGISAAALVRGRVVKMKTSPAAGKPVIFLLPIGLIIVLRAVKY